MAKKKRTLDLPSPWSDFELFSTREWPENVTREAKLLDDKFKDVHNVFHGLGGHLLENMVVVIVLHNVVALYGRKHGIGGEV